MNFLATVKVPQFDEKMVGKIIDNAITTAAQRVANMVIRVARENAPVSPTQAEIDAERASRRKRKTRKASKSKRRSRKNRPTPGGLERSIAVAVDGTGDATQVAVFVRDPSEAVKYADYIHNQKGVKWHKRGIGTRNKGDQADEKFIERAVYDNERKWYEMFKKAAYDAVK